MIIQARVVMSLLVNQLILHLRIDQEKVFIGGGLDYITGKGC